MNTQSPQPRFSEGISNAPPDGGSDGDIVNIFDLVRNIWRQKWVVVGSAVLMGGLVAVGLSFVVPRYSATAKVMLNPRETRVVTSQEVVSDLDLSNPVIESEVALIRSSVLLEAAAREIGLPQLAEFDPTQMSQPEWSRRLDLAVERVTMFLEGDEVLDAEPPKQPDDAEAPGPEAAETSTETADNLYRRVVGRMRRYIDVYQQGSSYVISISASAEDPELVALLVNTVAERYIASQLEERIEGTRRATKWLETRVADLREQVALAEDAVEAHRAEKLMADGGGLDTASQQLVAMSGQLAAARADKAAAQARHDQITALVDAEGAAAAAEVLSSPLVAILRENQLALTRQRADLATIYGPRHPQRVRLDAEIARGEADLADEVGKIIKELEKEVAVASIRERSVAADVFGLEERVSSISRTSTSLRDLEREAFALRTVYENMLSRLKETRAHEALAQAEAKVIEYALPPGAPSYPRSKLLVSAAAVAGAGLGFGFVLMLELTSQTFRSTQQVVRETRLPVLAALPRGRRRRNAPEVLKVLGETNDGNYGERIRQVRTALLFGAGDPPRSVAITSSLPGEGKTDTTLALAHMNALMGKRVIVVDCDFRNGALCRGFGWTVGKDFASVLRGDAALDEAIVSDHAVGFDVLPVAGPVENVSDMLTPGRFRKIVEDLSGRYDLLIVDAPAVLNAAHARVIVRSTDALIYLVKWDSTAVSTVRQGLGALAELGISPNGIVLTQVKRKRISEFRQVSYAMAARGEGRA